MSRPKTIPTGYQVRVLATEKLIGYFRFHVALPTGARTDGKRMVQFAKPPPAGAGSSSVGPILLTDLDKNIVWANNLAEVEDCLNFVAVQGAEETGGF